MSLAIEYAMRKKKKCMADGGPVNSQYDSFAKGVKDAFMGPEAKAAPPSPPPQKEEKDLDPVTSGMKKAFNKPGYAKGGDVKGVHKPIFSDSNESHAGHYVNMAKDARQDAGGKYSGYVEPLAQRREENAKRSHKEVLHEIHEMKDRDRKYLAEGGEVEEEASGYEPMPCENCGHVSKGESGYEDEDMLSSIMKKHMYSEGGKVANDDMPIADSEPAEYDELAKDDDLEFHETAKNSGDEDGDKAEGEDREDTLSRIMKSRKKKDKMPRPA